MLLILIRGGEGGEAFFSVHEIPRIGRGEVTRGEWSLPAKGRTLFGDPCAWGFSSETQSALNKKGDAYIALGRLFQEERQDFRVPRHVNRRFRKDGRGEERS